MHTANVLEPIRASASQQLSSLAYQPFLHIHVSQLCVSYTCVYWMPIDIVEVYRTQWLSNIQKSIEPNILCTILSIELTIKLIFPHQKIPRRNQSQWSTFPHLFFQFSQVINRLFHFTLVGFHGIARVQEDSITIRTERKIKLIMLLRDGVIIPRISKDIPGGRDHFGERPRNFDCQYPKWHRRFIPTTYLLKTLMWFTRFLGM